MEFADIKVGSAYSFKRRVTKADVIEFAELTGDINKLHIDEDFGVKSPFKKNIAHGMLVASFFSTIVGMYCPGENGLFLQQGVNFRSPVYYDDNLEIRGIVVSKNEAIRVVTIRMEAYRGGELVVDGQAKVKLLR